MKHKLKKISEVGKYILFECRNCKDRIVAESEEEAMRLYAGEDCRK